MQFSSLGSTEVTVLKAEFIWQFSQDHPE